MPLHLYVCDGCGFQVEQYRSIQTGGNAILPLCPHCTWESCPPVWMRWSVPVVAMDAKEPFQRWEVTRQQPIKDPESGQWVQGQVTETIDSVAKARLIEADSAQRYIDGEGEPLRFRVYNQDRSNRDQNSFGASGSIGGRTYDSGQTPQPKPNISTTRHGQRKPRVATARGGGVSALKGSR